MCLIYTVLAKLYLMTFFLTLPLTVCKHPYRDHYCTDRHQATYCDQLGTAYFVLGIDPVFGEIMQGVSEAKTGTRRPQSAVPLHYYFTIKEGLWCWGYEYEHKQSTYESSERGDHIPKGSNRRRVSSGGIAPGPN